jgi:Capsule assembly protein Wzi
MPLNALMRTFRTSCGRPYLVGIFVALLATLVGRGDAQQAALPDSADATRTTDSYGSVYVPLDSWIYEAFDRLYALGFADTAYLGMKPWTRLSCVHILEETESAVSLTPDSSEAHRIFDALRAEFALDRQMEKGGGRVMNATVEEMYTRILGIAGEPLTESAHLGETLTNDYGRPYARGLNAFNGFEAYAQMNRFTLNVRGEYQHAPGLAPLPQTALDAFAAADEIPVQSSDLLPVPQTDVFRILDANASVHLRGHEISVGKSEDWWGPGKLGSMAWSNNAPPIYAFRINRVEPLSIPLLSRVTGPFRYEGFFGELKGWTQPRNPWVHAEKFSFKPSRNLEFGFSRVVIFAGEGHVPLTFGSFWHSFTSFSNVSVAEKESRNDPGERHSSFDFTWRLPGLTRWVTLYSDSIVHDDTSPIDAPRRAAVEPGIYLSRVPGLPHLDFHVEAASTDTPAGTIDGGHFIYWEGQYRNGYTNQGHLLGSWVGREGKGGQAWLTYWLSPRESVQFSYRNAKVATGFMPGGTTQNDWSVRIVKRLTQNTELTAFGQYEAWKAPLLTPGRTTNFAGLLQLAYFPKWRWER